MKTSKLTKLIKKTINHHQAITTATQEKLRNENFSFNTIGKYLGIKSKTLFIIRKEKNNVPVFYVGIGTAAEKYGYYEQNFGFTLEISEKMFNTLKKEAVDGDNIYVDLSDKKNIWL